MGFIFSPDQTTVYSTQHILKKHSGVFFNNHKETGTLDLWFTKTEMPERLKFSSVQELNDYLEYMNSNLSIIYTDTMLGTYEDMVFQLDEIIAIERKDKTITANLIYKNSTLSNVIFTFDNRSLTFIAWKELTKDLKVGLFPSKPEDIRFHMEPDFLNRRISIKDTINHLKNKFSKKRK